MLATTIEKEVMKFDDLCYILPNEIGKILRECPISGRNIEILRNYFKKESLVLAILMNNPASFKMLEIIYGSSIPELPMDNFIYNSLSAQALRSRLNKVIEFCCNIIHDSIGFGKFKIANFGSGPGRDTFAIARYFCSKNISLQIFNIDIDGDAINKGREIAEEPCFRKFNNPVFLEGNFLKHQFKQEIKLGMLIGVLCSISKKKCISVLKKLRDNFDREGILIASCVAPAMKECDPKMDYILEYIAGWVLDYKFLEELKEIFFEGGWDVREDDNFSDCFGFHNMVFGKIK